MASVVIYHPDGSTETIPGTVGWSDRREIGHTRKLNIIVDRDQAQSVSLTRKEDEVELSGQYRGVLTDIKTGGAAWTLVVRSPEWYANTQVPTLGGDRRQGDDQTLITDLINEVPDWSVGSIANLTGQMTFVFNHAFPHEGLRQIEKNVPGELEWEGDGTVNYVDDLGTDKTGSITLSAANGNLENGINIKERGRKFEATHLRVIGAHEGEAQKFAQLVPSADPNSYENDIRYTQPRWSDSDDTEWGRWENKDVMSQDTIEEEAAALADEITEEYVEATATVDGEDLALGDWVHVEKPDADLNRDMRIHRIKTRTKPDTTAAVVDEVLLSTRTVARDSVSDQGRDIQRFNTAFQGSSVIVQGGGGRQPVDGVVDAQESFRYPPIEYEHEALLEVAGLPYRAYSSGAENNPQFINAGQQAQQGGSVNLTNGDWTTLAGYDPSQTSPEAQETHFDMLIRQTGGSLAGRNTLDARLSFNFGTDGYWPDQSGTDFMRVGTGVNQDIMSRGVSLAGDFSDLAQIELQVKVDVLDQVSDDVDLVGGPLLDYQGVHDHPPDPGIIEFSNETPSNVDVLVNGTTVATDIGSGTFETVVDISDELTRDAWNDIAATSDTLGHIKLTPYLEAYKQIGQR